MQKVFRIGEISINVGKFRFPLEDRNKMYGVRREDYFSAKFHRNVLQMTEHFGNFPLVKMEENRKINTKKNREKSWPRFGRLAGEELRPPEVLVALLLRWPLSREVRARRREREKE